MLRARTLIPALAVGIPVIAAIPGGSMIAAILGISFLIFIHEWGHYTACRMTGTRTETFSIGFGPRLFGWERPKEGKRRFTIGARQLDPDDHSMDFRVAVIPLGGYVKMAGGEIIGDTRSSDPSEFVNKSAWARIFIVSAGVIMNVITAFAFYGVAYGMQIPLEPPVIGAVQPGDPAWMAGLEPGEEITQINDEEIRSYQDVIIQIVHLPSGEKARFQLQKDDDTKRAVDVTPYYDEAEGRLKVGIGNAFEVRLSDGSDETVIGHREHLTAAGVPIRGGASFPQLYARALNAGLADVVLQRDDGSSFTLRLGSREVASTDEKPTYKVGLAPFGHPSVKVARGDTPLQHGDRVIALESGGARTPVHSQHDLERTYFRKDVEALIYIRGNGLEQRWELDRPMHAVLADIVFDAPKGNRVALLDKGVLTETADGLFRYPSSPAADAGIQTGDAVLKIGKKKISEFTDLIAALSGAGDEPLVFTVQSEGKPERVVEVTPVALVPLGKPVIELMRYKEPHDTKGFGDALALAGAKTWREISTVFRTIGALFSGTINFNKNIAGPITLVTVSRDVAETTFAELLWFLAYISVMLAVLNILPIPVLDGGHLLFIIIEKIKGSPLKEATMYRMQQIGMLLLLTLMFFAFKNDIARLL